VQSNGNGGKKRELAGIFQPVFDLRHEILSRGKKNSENCSKFNNTTDSISFHERKQQNPQQQKPRS
jgi:hypothetical protein